MRTIFVWCAFLFSLFLISWVDARESNTKIECFREVATIQNSDNFLLQTRYDDIFLQKWTESLEPSLLKYSYKYPAFTTNIEQFEEQDSYNNVYSYEKIDTRENTKIILTIRDPIATEYFSLDFIHDSKLYSPVYFVSEDNEKSYSRILKNDISDYSPTHVKIVFEPKSDEDIREVIEIKKLQLVRNDFLWKIPKNNLSWEIKIFWWNTCGQTRDTILTQKENINFQNIISPIFSENIIYLKNRLDSDNDGIKDYYDNCVYINNPDQKDINQNTIWDACEFDSDNDGVSDSIDNCRNTPNQDQKDDDKDNIWNACDNCELYNPDQKDEDENGIWDVCDQAKQRLEENDDDSDGIINFRDNCRWIANPNQKDSDNDWVGDTCDNCINIQNPEQEDQNENWVGDICEDSDQDGINGLRDNCIWVSNPDQKDNDNDWVGDVCEDNDKDGIIFVEDNCPYEYNPEQKDFDNDAIGNICDESDDRVLESNKTLFIILMLIIGTVFLGWIFFVWQKMKK